MRFCKAVVLILGLGLLVGGCAAKSKPVVLPVGTMNAEQVYQLFADKTVESVTIKSGRVSKTYYSPDGELRQLQDGEKRIGNWRVREDGRICLDIEEGSSKCRIVVREGDTYVKYVVKSDGAHRPVVTYKSFQEGNPLGL